MIRLRFTPIAVTAFVCLAVCQSTEEETPEGPVIAGVYDATVDFSSFQTFDVVGPEDKPIDEGEDEGEDENEDENDEQAPPPRSLIEANRIAVIHSIISEMESRGYVRDQDAPDLLVTPFVRVQDVEVLIQTTAWSNYYYGWYWGYGYDWYDADLITLPAGTLVIDAIDVRDRADGDDDELVFRGSATVILPDEPTDVSDRIPAIVSDMFDFWPSE